jgi:hypothetical protein
MKKVKSVGIICVLLVLTLFFMCFCQALLMPKYMTSTKEGALIAEYYSETSGHDVIFIGDCEVYENISPITLWENYGITSFIRGSAQQLVWQSYYLLEETLEYETPEVVVFNVLAMKYNEPQNEAYNRMTLDGMRWSKSKKASVLASMTEEESFLSYVFPLLRFHSRWSELTSEDFRYIFHKDTISYNGYLMQTGVKPVTTFPRAQVLSDYSFGDTAYEYLDKITALCKERGITLVLMKAPTIYPVWYDEWELQMEDYAGENELMYINFLEMTDDIGIDWSEDTYDAGLHLNVSGAEKLSVFFGKILKEKYNLKDHRNDEELAVIWKKKEDDYEKEKAIRLEN